MVRIVSCRMVGMAGVVHSNDVIGACICSNDDSHVNVCGSAHCGYVANGSVAMAAFIKEQLQGHGCTGSVNHTYMYVYVYMYMYKCT